MNELTEVEPSPCVELRTKNASPKIHSTRCLVRSGMMLIAYLGEAPMMDITSFMETYKRAWETSDENLLAALFAEDGIYRNTPFAEQRGREAIKAYWQRTKLQSDIHLTYDVLQRHEHGGIAHWRTTYRVTSEELFRIWAASSGTNLLARKKGDPLPRLVLDGMAVVELDAKRLCREFRIWWHSQMAED